MANKKNVFYKSIQIYKIPNWQLKKKVNEKGVKLLISNCIKSNY